MRFEIIFFSNGLKDSLKVNDGGLISLVELKLDKLMSFEKSIFGIILNFPRLCLTEDLIIAYIDFSSSNLTSVFVG